MELDKRAPELQVMRDGRYVVVEGGVFEQTVGERGFDYKKTESKQVGNLEPCMATKK